MTKLLYIPNGSYLKIWKYTNEGSYEFTYEWEEYCKKMNTTLNDFIKLISNSDTNIDNEWLTNNNIEEDHKFLEAEFEIIYD